MKTYFWRRAVSLGLAVLLVCTSLQMNTYAEDFEAEYDEDSFTEDDRLENDNEDFQFEDISSENDDSFEAESESRLEFEEEMDHYDVVVLQNDEYEYYIQNGEATIGEYIGTDTDVVVPEEIDGYPVTKIVSPGFSSHKDIEHVTLPDTLTYMGSSFRNCSSLKEIEIPENVDYFAGYAFYNCTSLERVVLSNNIKEIGTDAFLKCYALAEVNIPKNIKIIGDGTFQMCESLTEIVLPDGIESIGGSAFQGCYSLESINLPDSLTYIGNSAFAYDRSLKEIKIPEKIEKIEFLTFGYCTALEKIELPDHIYEIGDKAFEYCHSFESIRLPNKLEKIGSNAFRGCDKLKTIWMGNSVKTIVKEAFGDYGKLEDVYYSGTEEQWNQININAYHNNNLLNANIHFLDKKTAEDTEADQYIIEEVKKYTSDKLFAQWEGIINSNISVDEKFRRLSELTYNAGISDPKEGIKYLSETSPYRSSYLALTTDELYGAYNYASWIMSPAGTPARAALYSSGLIFNLEAFDYVGSLVNSETPGIKKYKQMLLDFMEFNNKETDTTVAFGKTKKSLDTLQTTLKLCDIATDAEIDAVMDELVTCTDPVREAALQKEWVFLTAEKIEPVPDGKYKEIFLNCKGIQKVLGASTSVLSFITDSADDILAIMEINENLEKYENYKGFLQTIAGAEDAPYELKAAATQLLVQLDENYYQNILKVLTSFISTSNDIYGMVVNKTWLENMLEKAGVSTLSELLSDAASTLKLGVVISNIVVDTGGLSREISETIGYAQCAAIFNRKLQQDKRAFLANPSSDNAWQFFEDYTMLWQLRYKGEEQYLASSSVKMYLAADIPLKDYKDKYLLVQNNLSTLRKSRFEIAEGIAVPESVRYVKKAVISCPVDICVYDSVGNLIVELKDGELSDISNEHGRFLVVQDLYTGEYTKVICQSVDEELTIKMSAVDDGLVDYKLADASADTYKTFDKVPVSVGDVVQVNENEYEFVEGEHKGEKESLISKDTEVYVAPESIEADQTEVNLEVGDSQVVKAKILPENASNTVVDWFSMDDSIATVSNGKITGVEQGETVIVGKVADHSDLSIKITVHVSEASETEPDQEEYIPGDVNEDGNVNAKDVTMIRRHIVGEYEQTINMNAADVNEDNAINGKDVVLIRKFIVGDDVQLKSALQHPSDDSDSNVKSVK